MKRIYGLIFLFSVCFSAFAQNGSRERIRINQLGFYPSGPKNAAVLTENPKDYSVRSLATGTMVFEGKTTTPVKSHISGKSYAIADFSDLKTPGEYELVIDGVGNSYPFQIKKDVHRELSKAAIKNFYFQRMSITLEEKFAGKWKRPAGHPDNVVLIHESAASATISAGTQISSPRGWYDAGDYNKYIVNSGITMGTILSAFEDFPEYYSELSLNIPESTNEVPDILDEAIWNLRWMLTMQDGIDGGVYHKLTNAKFDGMVMPHEATARRYVVQKSTAAALDFAAVTAQAARILAKYEKQLPGMRDSCLRASRLAYAWALKNPEMLYDQDKMNREFEPDVVTGAYGDKNVNDEFFWAASELYVTTREQSFVGDLKIHYDTTLSIPGWNNVRLCGYYSLLRAKNDLRKTDPALFHEIETAFLTFADKLMARRESNALNCVMGKNAGDFVWGSSAVAANQAIVLVAAFRLTNKEVYLQNALHNLDYLLGRNGTGYSFVTGYGDKTPMHPHHRPSEADGVVEPIPGMLSGGPNPSMQDKCKYSSTFPDEAFVDDVCSYASNEIAINWNAPLAYITGAIEALQSRIGYTRISGN